MFDVFKRQEEKRGEKEKKWLKAGGWRTLSLLKNLNLLIQRLGTGGEF